jgi:hypothetical protein
VCANPTKPWDYNRLTENHRISWKIIAGNPSKPWNYRILSKDPKITWRIVCSNPNKPWDYKGLSKNPNITWDIVCAHPEKNWNYDCLSMNSNITWDIVCANPDKPWDYSGLSQNVNITWDIVHTNMDKPWNYTFLSKNPNITWDIVCANNVPWNFYFYGMNPTITIDIVETTYMILYVNAELVKNMFVKMRIEYYRKVIKLYFVTFVFEELMQKCFHPRNIKKFVGWGFDDGDDDDAKSTETNKWCEVVKQPERRCRTRHLRASIVRMAIYKLFGWSLNCRIYPS